jgi:tetratricopeptide (TPR) repeat protein
LSPQSHPLVQRGRQAYQARDYFAALSLCEMQLKTNPDDLEALELKSNILQARGDARGAEGTMRQALQFDPACEWALHELTELLRRSGQHQAAETAARHALLARPDAAQAHLQLADILSEKGDLPAAEFHYRQALSLAGPHPQILLSLAAGLFEQNRLDEAEPLLSQAVKLQPEGTAALLLLARLYEARRDMANAWLWLDRAETAGRKAGEDFTPVRAQFLAHGDKFKDALELLDKVRTPLTADGQLERARLLDRLGRPDEAWNEARAAKARMARESGRSYDGGRVQTEFAALKAFFEPDMLTRLPQAPTRRDVPQPVFILGFPRSGTGLIECILSNHDQISAGGDLPYVGEWQGLLERLLPTAQPYPQRLAQLQMADLHHVTGSLRDHYLGRAEASGVTRERRPLFTDRSARNATDLPLIRFAFPQAAMIRVVRHPLDVAVSLLLNTARDPFDCGYAIETIIEHLVARHDLDHAYDMALEQPALVVRYEDLTADPEGGVRRMLGYLGVDFDPYCVMFNEHRRDGRVLKPLHDRSTGHWRAYARGLSPYFDRIAPVVESLGYSL